MSVRSFAQVAPTPGTIALNAYIFGYGGHSLVTPHAALRQRWWLDEHIESKVTREFILARFGSAERARLDEQILSDGDDLSNDTFMDYILSNAKRLFLILTEIGRPFHIFYSTSWGWKDEDLPIRLEHVGKLQLPSMGKNIDKIFFDAQFIYTLRQLEQGSFIDYGTRELIAMDHVNELPPAVTLQAWDRVQLPHRPDDTFMRRKYCVGENENHREVLESFRRDVQKAQELAHKHIASVWASYCLKGNAYVLSDFVGEHTLRSFIDHRIPAQFFWVSGADRTMVLCQWMHCLAHALAFLHRRGVAHTAIWPTNILINKSNRIAFADVGSLRTFQRGKRMEELEDYNYSAPELPIAHSLSSPVRAPRSSVRKRCSGGSNSSLIGSCEASTRSNSVCTSTTSPSSTSMAGLRIDTEVAKKHSPKRSPPVIVRNFSRPVAGHQPYPISPISPLSTASTSSETRIFRGPPAPFSPLTRDTDLRPSSPSAAADIFSLGCIYLDLLTFVLKGKVTEFVKHRVSKVPVPSTTGKKTKIRFRADTSFHSALGASDTHSPPAPTLNPVPNKLESWIAVLRAEAAKHHPVHSYVYTRVPPLLDLVGLMLSPTPALRPTAREVRDRIKEILNPVQPDSALASSTHPLCCGGSDSLAEAAEIKAPPPSRPDSTSRSPASTSDGTMTYFGGSEGYTSAASAGEAIKPLPRNKKSSRQSKRESQEDGAETASLFRPESLRKLGMGALAARWRRSGRLPAHGERASSNSESPSSPQSPLRTSETAAAPSPPAASPETRKPIWRSRGAALFAHQ